MRKYFFALRRKTINKGLKTGPLDTGFHSKTSKSYNVMQLSERCKCSVKYVLQKETLMAFGLKNGDYLILKMLFKSDPPQV